MLIKLTGTNVNVDATPQNKRSSNVMMLKNLGSSFARTVNSKQSSFKN